MTYARPWKPSTAASSSAAPPQCPPSPPLSIALICNHRVGLPADVPVVCFSGLDVLTDLPLAVRAFEIVRAQRPDARLLLVGPTEEEALTAWRAGSSMAATARAVRALGKVPHQELPDVLPAADLFLLPFPGKIANIGRWPNKIGDYMAVGRPTVANPVGELGELFRRYPVGLLAGDTPAEMAAAALRLLDDPDLANAIGRGAREAAETELSWASQIARLEAWYQRILAKTVAPGTSHPHEDLRSRPPSRATTRQST